MSSAPEDALDLLGDLVPALLGAAVNVSHTIGRLHDLGATSVRPDDLVALTQITDAITLLAHARQHLINDADRLSDLLSGS